MTTKQQAINIALELLNEMMRCSQTSHGGKLADVPKPHIYRSQVPGMKRIVRVHSARYLGGGHYHVSLSEDDDELWDQSSKCWRAAWDDEAKAGRRFEERLNRASEVAPWFARMIAEHFAGDGYEMIGVHGDAPVYGHEGD